MPCPSIAPNHFGRVPIVLGRFNSFCSDPNQFGQVQIIKISPENLIWTWPKLFGPDQSDLGTTKTICTRTKQLGGRKLFWTYREGQGICK